MVKSLPAVQESQVQSLSWEDPLEKEMAIHSSILAWKIPRMGVWQATAHWVTKSRTLCLPTTWLFASLWFWHFATLWPDSLSHSAWLSLTWAWLFCHRGMILVLTGPDSGHLYGLTLVLIGPWVWSSKGPDLVLTTVWPCSSLWPDSVPHYTLTLVLTMAWP